MILGIILTLFSFFSFMGFFSKNEWRIPLIELSHELEEDTQLKKQNKNVKNNILNILLFFIFLYVIGIYLITTSNSINIVLFYYIFFTYLFLTFFFLKRIVEMLLILFSNNRKLKNYLYSPYFFAWRRDHLHKYSDAQIAKAILSVCNIKEKIPFDENTKLSDFLIDLHRATRPEKESERYPSILELNRRYAEKMRYF